jgi:RimJ/RimL family protein N-acetyltransferase
MNALLTGELVKLVAPDPAGDPEIMAGWHRDSEFLQLAYGRIAELWTAARIKARMERYLDEPSEHSFTIRTLADDKLIGNLGVWAEMPHGDGFIWILIGERDYWGRGYGTDAMRVLMRYAFDELNLERLTLRVFAFNTRAIRSYEKCGFVHEGRQRQALNRIGQRWDEVWMGILRDEWNKEREP